MKQYPITQDGAQVGTALLERQGMFWMIRCRCNAKLQQTMRIILRTGRQTHDLGVCVSHSDGWGLNARIPVKQAAAEEMTFFLESVGQDDFLPLSPEQPFPEIAKLEQSRFAVKEGKTGVAPKN